MPQVQVIQPIQQQPKRLRVAAYARVSSDSEDQLNSLAVQVDYYTHLIQENPNWEFAGIYTDEGITGTSTKRREQFNRLMDDCRAGLIDRVLVKSASRFARNTADALSSVRELKSLGVTVAFEKEGFDTETSNGEMLLSIICAVAQEESLSISQNMKWGIHKRMRTGNYITNATPFGYTQINHQLVPEKNNAMIVNDIFKSYLSGMSINEIAEHLNTIYPKENSKWNPRTIHAILRNEKYIGDSLYQKTYTTDSLPLKRYLNTGQRSKYYAMETHEGIISKTDYEKVQNLLAKKSITGEIDRTCVFSKKIYCSICGAICSRKGPPTQGFVKTMCKMVGSGLEQPYEVLLKEFNSNYSASRGALLEAWEAYKMRRVWLVDGFCQPVYELWLAEAVARGRIKAPGFFDDPLLRAAWCGARWIGPVQGTLDPKKEVEAAILQVHHGFRTHEQVARELGGGDWEENVEQLKRENEMLKAAGVEKVEETTKSMIEGGDKDGEGQQNPGGGEE